MVCHQSLSSTMSTTELSLKISENMEPPALANHAMICKMFSVGKNVPTAYHCM